MEDDQQGLVNSERRGRVTRLLLRGDDEAVQRANGGWPRCVGGRWGERGQGDEGCGWVIHGVYYTSKDFCLFQ